MEKKNLKRQIATLEAHIPSRTLRIKEPEERMITFVINTENEHTAFFNLGIKISARIKHLTERIFLSFA